MTSSDPLAEAAIAPIASGMLVGLGTGRAATRAIHALARRVTEGGLLVHCVATSAASHELGRSLGLAVLPMEDITAIDYLFDGADEVDALLRMIKGRGGAMTREKIVARAASRRVYLVQRSKVVPRLGVTCPLPIEVMSFGMAATRRLIENLGVIGDWRISEGGSLSITDNHNPILDVALPEKVEIESLRAALDATPGVVGHGLFLTEADEVVIEDADGARVTTQRR